MRLAFRILLLTLSAVGLSSIDAADNLSPRLRRPVDAVWMIPGQVLLTANSRSGTLSVVDLATHSVVHEAVARLQGTQASWHDARTAVAAETAASYNALRGCEAVVLQTPSSRRSSVTRGFPRKR